MKFTTRKWTDLTSKIDKLFIGVGINSDSWFLQKEIKKAT
jgi:hypothetical protein